MHFTSSILALGFASYATAHVVLTTPTPFGKSTLDNSPLDATGSDFPCKQRPGVYDAEGASNPMALGSTQPMNFMGSAVHGGGSCQVSITYDSKPTKDSVWKVIHSIEGGCPMKNIAGNNGDGATIASPDTYHFTIPTGLPTGNAVLAWTWFNKVGNREMYMNCAPVSLGAASEKRTSGEESLVGNLTQLVERDQSFYNSLPDMFVANIGDNCGTAPSADLAFPNPGSSLEKFGDSTPVDPVGESCQAAGAAPDAPTTTGGTAPTATSAPIISATTDATTVISAPIISATTDATTVTSAPVVSLAVSAGVFFEHGATAAAPATTLATSAAAPVASTPASPAVVAQVAAVGGTASAPAIPVVGGSAITVGQFCPDQEGEWNCIDGSSFQRCASGQWSEVQGLSAGTQCETGVSQNIKIVAIPAAKREAHFANPHVRRHLKRSI